MLSYILLDENPLVHWQYLERANVDMIQQMTELLTCQRSLQSALVEVIWTRPPTPASTGSSTARMFWYISGRGRRTHPGKGLLPLRRQRALRPQPGGGPH